VGTDSLTVSAGPSREEGVEIASDEQILILDDVFFELNSAHLNEAFTFRLDSLVALLLAHENLTVSISGHTDNKGDETYNLSLSRARAEAVALYLRKNKIRESRISFQGEGSARPRASNNTVAGRKKNRRVEIRISNQ
jgi:outer membrane protein OmpA-like peptidoglycan-associated protein